MHKMRLNTRTLLLFQKWLFPFLLILLCLLIASFGNEYSLLLRYERNEIFNGQLYRLLSGHLVHLGWPHLFINLSGVIVIFVLFQSTFTWRYWLLFFLASALGTSFGLLLFNPKILWYVGLSGVLHALFVTAVIKNVGKFNYNDLILPSLIIIKLVWEQFSGALPGSEIISQGKVVIDAHLYGSVTGLFLGLVSRKLYPD